MLGMHCDSFLPLNVPAPHLIQRASSSIGYQFEMPVELVGKLIGRRGCTIQHISQHSRARIGVNDSPFPTMKICRIEGRCPVRVTDRD